MCGTPQQTLDEDLDRSLNGIGQPSPVGAGRDFSAAGTQGDGIFALIGGVIVALVGIANKASVITGIGTVIVAGLSLLIVFNVFGNFGSVDIGSVGSGLFLTGLASVFALIAGLKVIGETRR